MILKCIFLTYLDHRILYQYVHLHSYTDVVLEILFNIHYAVATNTITGVQSYDVTTKNYWHNIGLKLNCYIIHKSHWQLPRNTNLDL